jgi:hypothetical protein
MMIAHTLLEDRPALTNYQPLVDVEDGQALAQAIVDTIREPLLVLDQDLRVVGASRSFYLTFKMVRQDVQVVRLVGAEADYSIFDSHDLFEI